MTHRGKEDDDDADAFARAMTDVVPLRPDPRGRIRTRPVQARAATRDQPPHAQASAAADPTEPGTAVDAFAANGVDRRELRKLKRGEHAAEDACDLHGMTAAAACVRVSRFIDHSRQRGLRCVRIVHGRGLHSEGETAVLKSRVRVHLRRHPGVLAFADAPRNDGAGGAVYVLLRR